jgi:hypothetical protein
VQHFLGAKTRMISKLSREIAAKNTWGDGLYLVFLMSKQQVISPSIYAIS